MAYTSLDRSYCSVEIFLLKTIFSHQSLAEKINKNTVTFLKHVYFRENRVGHGYFPYRWGTGDYTKPISIGL